MHNWKILPLALTHIYWKSKKFKVHSNSNIDIKYVSFQYATKKL